MARNWVNFNSNFNNSRSGSFRRPLKFNNYEGQNNFNSVDNIHNSNLANQTKPPRDFSHLFAVDKSTGNIKLQHSSNRFSGLFSDTINQDIVLESTIDNLSTKRSKLVEWLAFDEKSKKKSFLETAFYEDDEEDEHELGPIEITPFKTESKPKRGIFFTDDKNKENLPIDNADDLEEEYLPIIKHSRTWDKKKEEKGENNQQPAEALFQLNAAKPSFEEEYLSRPYNKVFNMYDKSVPIAYALFAVLWILGGHRFYVRKFISGALQLVLGVVVIALLIISIPHVKEVYNSYYSNKHSKVMQLAAKKALYPHMLIVKNTAIGNNYGNLLYGVLFILGGVGATIAIMWWLFDFFTLDNQVQDYNAYLAYKDHRDRAENGDFDEAVDIYDFDDKNYGIADYGDEIT